MPNYVLTKTIPFFLSNINLLTPYYYGMCMFLDLSFMHDTFYLLLLPVLVSGFEKYKSENVIIYSLIITYIRAYLHECL